jgi:hypothetical protein
MKSNATNHGLNIKVTLFEKIYNAIDFYYLNVFIFILLFILSFYLISLIFKKEDKKSIVNLVGFYFAINILYMFLLVNKDWQHYYLTAFTLSPLLLLFFVNKFNKHKYYFIIGILSLQIGTHINEFNNVLTTGYHPEYEMTDKKQNEVSNSLIKDLEFTNKDNINILISPFTPFEYTKLGLNYNNVKIIYGPISEDMFKFNEKEVSKGIDLIVLSKNDVYFNKEKLKFMVDIQEYNRAIEIIKNFNKGEKYGYQKCIWQSLVFARLGRCIGFTKRKTRLCKVG